MSNQDLRRLRDLQLRGKYRDVILPMTVLRRLDTVLEDSKQAVLDMKAVLDEHGVVEQKSALRQAARQAFYNTSSFTLRDLRARASRPGDESRRLRPASPPRQPRRVLALRGAGTPLQRGYQRSSWRA